MTDEEYLQAFREELIAEFSPVWLACMRSIKKKSYLTENTTTLDESFSKYVESINSLIDQSFLEGLVHAAREPLESFYPILQDVTVGLSWTDDINACVFSMKDQAKGIILNNLPFLLMPALFRLTTEYFSSANDNCEPQPGEDSFHKAFLDTSAFSAKTLSENVSPETSQLTRVFGLQPSLSDRTCALIVAQYILLHEFGHIVLGHIGDASSGRITLRMSPSGNPVETFCYAQEQELAADKFAAEKLKVMYATRAAKLEKQRDRDLLMCGIHTSICIFFGSLKARSFQASEPRNLESTHPDAWYRWKEFNEQWKEYENSLTLLLSESLERLFFPGE